MKRIIGIGVSLLLLSSCIQEVQPVPEGSGSSSTGKAEALLELSLAVDTLESKAVISAASLPTGSKVGVHLVDATSTGLYNGHDYSNVLYTMSSGKLTSDQEVMLTPTSGTVYAYYPYVADGDIASLPINILSQTDYMWATPRSGMSFGNNSTTLAMRHVLAVASFQIVKGNYSGASKVTAVSIKGPHLHTTATYSGKNGTIGSLAGASKQIACVEGGFTLNTTGSTRNILLLPPTGSGTATVTITLDGYNRTVSIPSFKPVAGKRYRYVLTVNEEEIVVSNVVVNTWSDINDEYNIYVTGNTENIAINQSINADGKIEVVAVSMHSIELVDQVNVTGSVVSKQEVLSDIRARKITLSNITGDVYLNFNGLKKTHCVYKYFVPTGASVTYWDSDATMPEVIAKEVTSVKASTGTEYTVKVWHSAFSETILSEDWFGSAFFDNIRGSYLTYWEIPEGIMYTDGSGLGQVNGSTSSADYGQYFSAYIKFPKTMKEIGNHSFIYTKVSGVEFHPESEVAIGHRAFYSTQISSIVFPKKVSFKYDEQFTNCPLSGTLSTGNIEFQIPGCNGSYRFAGTGITELILAEGITVLGNTYNGMNFKDCQSLKSIDLPSTLTQLGGYDFCDCSSLSSITCRALSAPTIVTAFGYATFDDVSTSGKLIVPTGSTGYDVWLDYLNQSGSWIIEYSDNL